MNNTPKRLYIATKNKSKFESLKRAIDLFENILIIDIFDDSIPECEESGSTSLENAVVKADFYFNLLRENILAEDDAIYFDGLSINKQPGYIAKRMVGNKNPSSFWSDFIKNNSVKTGRIEKNFCLINQKGLRNTSVATIPFSVVIPGVIIGGHNPLNNFMAPEGFRNAFSKLTDSEKLKITKKFILPKLVSLVDKLV